MWENFLATTLMTASGLITKPSFTCAVELMKSHCISALDRPLDPIPSISCFATLLATQDVMVYRHLIYPFSPQVIFEATVSMERQGYIALDDIVLLNYPCCKYPFCSAHSSPADLSWAWGKCLAEQWKDVQFQEAQRIPGGVWRLWGRPAMRATETPIPCLEGHSYNNAAGGLSFALAEWLTITSSDRCAHSRVLLKLMCCY